MDLIKKWQEKLNGREYREELEPFEEEELKKDGIVVVFGCSDDLCEIHGALSSEIDCYGGNKEVYVREAECFVSPDYYDYSSDELIQIDLSKRPYIDISNTRDGWKYEIPDIPQAEFIIYEEDTIYCTGKLFYLKDFANWEKKEE